MNRSVIEGHASGPILACAEGLSFWGGVDPGTGRIIDMQHPLAGRPVAGTVMLMPTSRGSCTGSGVLLDLIQTGHAPAAIAFREPEDVLTLGALVSRHVFGRTIPILRLDAQTYDAVAAAPKADVAPGHLKVPGLDVALAAPNAGGLRLAPGDKAMLAGDHGSGARLAMTILRDMALAQAATDLIHVTRAHIDGCIYASPANLTVARAFAATGARVRVPTTMNAISVDHLDWRMQGVPPSFGEPASQLADAYVAMGARPTFTCAPYLLDGPPTLGEAIGWSESNAVIYANSVLGARTPKHPDFLDLCIALTGRAPRAGVYLDAHRAARRIIRVDRPDGHDDAFWPLLGWAAGRLSPDRVPLLTGLEGTAPSGDDLKALCAAFGTTSAAPMLHVDGITPEAHRVAPDADEATADVAVLRDAWQRLDPGPGRVDLVAIGSPHASLSEVRALAKLMDERTCADGVHLIVTLARWALDEACREGTAARLETAGVRLIPDLCWCSITEPVFPAGARTLMTNSGKYAHYAPGLHGRAVRFGSLAECAEAAATGQAPEGLPNWLL